MSDRLIQENVPLAPYTTLKVGGPALFLAKATREEQIPEALDFARKRGCPVFVLGGGSNLVVADSGFPGLVLKIELRGVQSPDEDDPGRIAAAAGEDWDGFVQYCLARNLAGIECLSGIAGTVGGAPIQNIGAYGQEAGEGILSVRVLDRETGRISELSNAECGFSYRSSIFNSAHKNRYVVLRVSFALLPSGRPRFHYPDLQNLFRDHTREPSLYEVRGAVLQIRKSKAMVLCEDDPDSRSVGSFFKNPVLPPNEAARIENEARNRGCLPSSDAMPRFPAPEGMEKVSAAWLIEQAGFHKGYVHGNAGISGKHTLAIINRGGATSQEITDLAHLIQDRVRDMFGVDLQPEPVFVGM